MIKKEDNKMRLYTIEENGTRTVAVEVAGTVIATGTPGGVAMGMNPPVFLKPGDAVRCEIEGIGVLENKVM